MPHSTAPDRCGLLLRLLFGGTAAVVLCASLCGCSRAFWRNQADRDTYRVTGEKLDDPRWFLPRIDLTPDPRSRFFDPYDPDKPPLPPDDPAAHQYMHQMGWIRGYKGWHRFGQALSVENPHWLEPFGLQPKVAPDDPYWATAEFAPPPEPADGVDGEAPQPPELQAWEGTEAEAAEQAFIVSPGPVFCPVPELRDLTLPQALELSYIHNRDYQTIIEELYLTALTLTFERFQFGVRYLGFGGLEPTTDVTLEKTGLVHRKLVNRRFGISQLLPTGGQWIVELANNTIWVFSGEGRSSTASVLSYSLVQPLMFGAGRRVVLEALSQSERNVLYAARDLARFRQVFFTETVAGGPSGGFLGLLEQRQIIDNQEANIRRLLEQLDMLRALAAQIPDELRVRLPELPDEAVPFAPEIAGQVRYEAPWLYWRVPPVEVQPQIMTDQQRRVLITLSDDAGWQEAVRVLFERIIEAEIRTQDILQLESQLLAQQAGVRTAGRVFEDNLDRFKVQLGLPPDMPVSLDESLLEQFQLIDPQLTAAERRVSQFVEEWARLLVDEPETAEIRRVVAGLDDLANLVNREGLELVARDFERLDEHRPRRLARLQREADRERFRRDLERDRRAFAVTQEDFALLRERIGQLAERSDAPELDEEGKFFIIREIAEIREELLRLIRNVQGVQIGLRVELITMQEFTLSEQDALCLGLENRVDLMNARAEVMDARRRIEFAANQLEAVLDVRIEGDIRTLPLGVGRRHFDFRHAQSSYRAGIGFTAPLDQIVERNDFRAAQIDYQRARRAYIEFEDLVKTQVRFSWRQLQVLEENFEIARQAVRVSALQLDNAVEQATDPDQAAGRNQGLVLLQALSTVLRAQNDLVGIWVEYERQRLNIYRDMGIMEIDARGIWIDEFYQRLAGAEGCIDEAWPFQAGEPGDADDDPQPRVGRPLPGGGGGDGGGDGVFGPVDEIAPLPRLLLPGDGVEPLPPPVPDAETAGDGPGGDRPDGGGGVHVPQPPREPLVPLPELHGVRDRGGQAGELPHRSD